MEFEQTKNKFLAPRVSGSSTAKNIQKKCLAFCLSFDVNTAWTGFITKYSEFDVHISNYSSFSFQNAMFYIRIVTLFLINNVFFNVWWKYYTQFISYIRHKDFFRKSFSSSVTLRVPPLDSETGWIWELLFELRPPNNEKLRG